MHDDCYAVWGRNQEMLRLIYPFQLFRSYEEALLHFKKHWRDDGGKSYFDWAKEGAWPPPTILRPNAAVYDGETWLLSVCLQERLSANELQDAQRRTEQEQLSKQITESIERAKGSGRWTKAPQKRQK